MSADEHEHVLSRALSCDFQPLAQRIQNLNIDQNKNTKKEGNDNLTISIQNGDNSDNEENEIKQPSDMDMITSSKYAHAVNPTIAGIAQKLKIEHLKRINKLPEHASNIEIGSIDHQREAEKDKIEEIMKKMEEEREEIKKQMNEAPKCIPLHRLSDKNIRNKIKCWIYNDINYSKHLLQTMRIFSIKREEPITGLQLHKFKAKYTKKLHEDELLQFMTKETVEIIFNDQHFDYEELKYQTAAEIGYFIYNIALNKLLTRIENECIDGVAFMDYYNDSEKRQWIKEETGWNDNEIYQIECVLWKENTLKKSQIEENMESILTNRLNELLANNIKKYMNECNVDLEQIHYKIKHGHKIEEFGDKILIMIDDLMRENNEEKKSDEYEMYGDDIVRKIYEAMADCFAFNYNSKDLEIPSNYKLNCHQDWTCCNCGNYNFCNRIGNKINVNLEICCLCGVTQRDSIIINLRNYDTYLMVHDHVIDTVVDTDHERKENESIQNDVQRMIATVQDSVDLKCLDRLDKESCPAILRLAANLIYYKRWLSTLKTDGTDNIMKTIDVDVEKYINNNLFKAVFIKSAKKISKITDDDRQLLTEMFEDNKDEIGNIQTFLNSAIKTFANTVREHTNIKVAIGCKLYRAIKYSLKRTAQTLQFGEFLSNATINSIDDDYHHILKSHINNGNPSTIENVFRFFNKVVHFEDSHPEQCISFKRKEKRINDVNLKNDDIKTNNHSLYNEDKNIWEKKQYYIQSQLDVIHTYLSHSNWQYFVQRHNHQNDKNNDNLQPLHLNQLNVSTELIKEKSIKYVTDSSDKIQVNVLNNGSKSNIAKYGFGIDHSHPILQPQYNSLRSEVLKNIFSRLTEDQFEIKLIKAIELQQIAISKHYARQLIAKYFRAEFNIIRNQHIGISHVLAIIIYTDITHFCTAFRETYRKMNSDEDDDAVTRRHIQFYYYGRALFEAVEFFGIEMGEKTKVYHGLNRIMGFEEFTAYFNQPISTTQSITTAKQFSKDSGIILTFKSGTKYFNDPSKIPKYLNVSWLSDYPHEDEKLFYGSHVIFQICNIYEAKTRVLKGHDLELNMLNKFQKTVKNQKIEWNKQSNEMIEALALLIESQQNDNEEMEEDDLKDDGEYITKYGKELFSYFCKNSSSKNICIQDYMSLPPKLKKALFGDTECISLKPLIKVFNNVTEIKLNYLPIDIKYEYVSNAMKDIWSEYKKSESTFNKIVFQSVTQEKDAKDNPHWVMMQRKTNKFGQNEWKSIYKKETESTGHCTHNLLFIHTANKINNENPISPRPSGTAVISPDIVANIEAIDNMDNIAMDQWSKIPMFFMQITSVNDDDFHIELIMNEVTNKRRKYYVKEINDSQIQQSIIIQKGNSAAAADIDIDEEHDALYHLALYENKKAKNPLPNSNQLQLIILKDENQYPPQNADYKPKCIDLRTLLKAKDEENKKINIYWSIPPNSFGNISYKITNDDSKEQEVISSLPYSIPFSSVSVSFRVVTIASVEDKIYESDQSEKITIAICK